jgi:3-hydroxybutyrate dehydrogenase
MLKGRVALVTGSTSGIGLAIARALAKDGADICITGSRGADAMEATQREIEIDFGVRCIHGQADLSDGSQAEAILAKTVASLGRFDILVNNAGIQFVAPVEDFPPQKWDQIIALNLSSAFHLTRAAIPGMKARRWGRIINMGSAHSLISSPFKSAYAAAKHGLAGFTKTVALETATQGITCNAICPGYVWTPLVEKQIPDMMAARGLTREQVINDVMLAAQPTKRFVSVEEVAALAVYLSGDMAGSITGAIISIDGGCTAA